MVDKHLLVDQQIVAVQALHQCIAFCSRFSARVVNDEVETGEIVVLQTVIALLRRFGKPLLPFIFGIGIPSERFVKRTEAVGSQRKRGEKLIVQLGVVARRRVGAGNIERMAEAAATGKIFRKGNAVFSHPAASLELAFGQYHANLSDRMRNAPHILDLPDSRHAEQSREIHRMYHALDIGQAYLK